MSSILDVAKVAKVSKSTVSRVLSGNNYGVSEETKIKVEKAAKDIGYVKNYLASSLRTNQTKTILLIIPDVSNNFWAEVARGAQDYFDKIGYSLILANSDGDNNKQLKYLKMAQRNKVDGILINTNDTLLDEIQSTGLPFVLIGNANSTSRFPRVSSDSYEGIKKALEYLYDNGHRKIAMVAPSNKNSALSKVSNRVNSYSDFLESHKMEFKEEYFFCCQPYLKDGEELAVKISKMKNPPTAIIAANDLFAAGFINEASRRKIKIPEDISVIGVDDIPLASMINPKLTTLEKPKHLLGKVAAETIISVIKGEEVIQNNKLPVNLIIRESSKSI